MRLRSKAKGRRRRQRQARRPLYRRLLLGCRLPCVRRYAESDSGSDIQRDSLLDVEGQPSLVGGPWEAPEETARHIVQLWDSAEDGIHRNESTDEPDPSSITNVPWGCHHLLMVEEVTSPAAENADVTTDMVGDAPESGDHAPRGHSPVPDDSSEHSSTQLQDVRFTFNRQFHMGSSHQYRVWKDVYGRNRHDTLPRRSNSESEASLGEEEEEGLPAGEYHQPGDDDPARAARGTAHDRPRTNQIAERLSDVSGPPYDGDGGFEPVFRAARSLPALPRSERDACEDAGDLPPPADNQPSFERHWSGLMATDQDDIIAVCTNPAMSGSNENTLSSGGSLGHSVGRPTRSSSLNDLDTLLDNFSLGTGSARNSIGRQCAAAPPPDAQQDTFGQLFAVSNRLARLTRHSRFGPQPTVETTREPVHLTSLFIDPNQSGPAEQSTPSVDSGAGNRTSSGSNSNSMQSSNSGGRQNVRQNWYVYDPRLLPGGAASDDARLTMETNYRGVQQCWSMPGIINPPAYEEVASGATTDLPPPYPESVSTLSSIGPPSDTDAPPPAPTDPPPPYEPHSTELDDITDGLSIDMDDEPEMFPPPAPPDLYDVPAPVAFPLAPPPDHDQDTPAPAPSDASDCTESEAAINEELDSILEEEEAAAGGTHHIAIGDIAENNHGFFMNSDSGAGRTATFGAALMSGVGFGAARPPVRWNRGMGLDRWASTSNWVSS